MVDAQGKDERAKYGDRLIKKFSTRLTKELGKGFDTTSLKRMRQFYLLIQKGAPMEHQLSWSHYKQLLPLKDITEINYYINQIIRYRLSKRILQEKIKSKEYQRLSDKTKIKLTNKEKLDVYDNIKNPIYINNYIDILLFNYIYNCFVVVEPKVTKSKKDHLGQVMFYINYVNKHLRNINQNKTIGIIVCRKDDKYLIEYSSDDRIRITTYELV